MFGLRLGKLGAALKAGSGSVGVTPLFSRDYEATGSLGANATFARSSSATIIDHEGVIRTVPSGAARFNGLRYVRNMLLRTEQMYENLVINGWIPYLASVTNQGNGVTRITASGANANLRFENSTVVLTNGNTYVMSVDLKLVSGDPTVNLYISDVNDNVLGSASISLTVDWQRFTISGLCGAGSANKAVRFYIGGGYSMSNATGDVIDARFPMLENATGRADTTTPSEYVSVGVESAPYHGANVDGVEYVTTENGNSVASNVVTEGTGAAITGGYLLMEPAATNQLLNSGTPATQTTGSLGTGDYVLWVEGAGSAAVTAGTATITGGGTATDGTPDLFTVTGAGTVTVTVTGTLDRFQLEAGSTPTSYIPTSGSAVTRAAETLSYSGIAADNETRAITDAGTVDVDDWDGIVDATINGADNLAQITSIDVYTTGERPA